VESGEGKGKGMPLSCHEAVQQSKGAAAIHSLISAVDGGEW
jgi:hypothetical protein